MSDPNKKMIFHAKTVRIDTHGSVARCKLAEITPDNDLVVHADVFKFRRADISACIIKGSERVTSILKISLCGVEVRIKGVRQNTPSKIESVSCENIVACHETYRASHLARRILQ